MEWCKASLIRLLILADFIFSKYRDSLTKPGLFYVGYIAIHSVVPIAAHSATQSDCRKAIMSLGIQNGYLHLLQKLFLLVLESFVATEALSADVLRIV